MPVANRLGGLLLGIVLLGAGVLLAVETALAAGSRAPWLLPLDRWQQTLGDTRVSDLRVLLISIGVGLIGVLVLVLQLRPWPPERVAVGQGGASAGWWVARDSVERRTATAAARVGGVHRARAKVRGSRRRWRVRLVAEADPAQREAVEQAVRTELARLGAPADVPVAVALRRGRVT